VLRTAVLVLEFRDRALVDLQRREELLLVEQQRPRALLVGIDSVGRLKVGGHAQDAAPTAGIQVSRRQTEGTGVLSLVIGFTLMADWPLVPRERTQLVGRDLVGASNRSREPVLANERVSMPRNVEVRLCCDVGNVARLDRVG